MLSTADSDDSDSAVVTPRGIKAAQMDVVMLDESARGMAALADKLDKQLRAAQADVEAASRHASELIEKATSVRV